LSGKRKAEEGRNALLILPGVLLSISGGRPSGAILYAITLSLSFPHTESSSKYFSLSNKVAVVFLLGLPAGGKKGGEQLDRPLYCIPREKTKRGLRRRRHLSSCPSKPKRRGE